MTDIGFMEFVSKFGGASNVFECSCSVCRDYLVGKCPGRKLSGLEVIERCIDLHDGLGSLDEGWGYIGEKGQASWI